MNDYILSDSRSEFQKQQKWYYLSAIQQPIVFGSSGFCGYTEVYIFDYYHAQKIKVKQAKMMLFCCKDKKELSEAFLDLALDKNFREVKYKEGLFLRECSENEIVIYEEWRKLKS